MSKCILVIFCTIGAFISSIDSADMLVQSIIDQRSIELIHSDSDHVADFVNSTNGWALSINNGAQWFRFGNNSEASPVGGVPDSFPSYLAVGRTGVYPGFAIAQSPLFETLPNRTASISVTFWMRGSVVTTNQFLISRKMDGPIYPLKPFLNLGNYGNSPSMNWTTEKSVIPPGAEPFQILLEGYTGQDLNNAIAVSKIVVSGVKEIPRPYPIIWQMKNNSLNGWTMGHSEGSSWILGSDDSHNQFLTVIGHIQRPGFTTLESPVLEPSSAIERLSIKFWLKGSIDTPVELTIRRRTADGTIDQEPFIDLRQFGTYNNPSWIPISAVIPHSDVPYQIVLEGFISFGVENLIAVADVALQTLGEKGVIVRNTYLFR